MALIAKETLFLMIKKKERMPDIFIHRIQYARVVYLSQDSRDICYIWLRVIISSF